MAARVPVRILFEQIGTVAKTYTVKANQTLTISAVTLNNSTSTARTATAEVTPSGGSALEVVSDLSVPVSGSAPTTVPGLVGHTLQAGDAIALTADANSAVTAWISGYLQS